MRDPEYWREYERTQLADDIAIEVIRYRAEHNLTQAELGRMIGMRQPNVARLEADDHEPSLAILARLSLKLWLDLSKTMLATGRCWNLWWPPTGQGPSTSTCSRW